MCAPPSVHWDGSWGLDLGWAGPCLVGLVAFSASKTSQSRSRSMRTMLCTKKLCYVFNFAAIVVLHNRERHKRLKHCAGFPPLAQQSRHRQHPLRKRHGRDDLPAPRSRSGDWNAAKQKDMPHSTAEPLHRYERCQAATLQSYWLEPQTLPSTPAAVPVVHLRAIAAESEGGKPLRTSSVCTLYCGNPTGEEAHLAIYVLHALTATQAVAPTGAPYPRTWS